MPATTKRTPKQIASMQAARKAEQKDKARAAHLLRRYELYLLGLDFHGAPLTEAGKRRAESIFAEHSIDALYSLFTKRRGLLAAA